MLRLENITKVYPTGEVLRDVTWEVKPGNRIGLVGVNGAGKSTQLKIIMGEIEPTSGNVIRPSELHIGYLNQEFEVDPCQTVREEFWTVFEEANAVQKKLGDIPIQMENAGPDELDTLIKVLDREQRRFEALDGYGLESKIEKILPDMGFHNDDGERLVSSFSGGWQMRMGLGKVMLKAPDLLLLDEPTNDLDVETLVSLGRAPHRRLGAPLSAAAQAAMERAMERMEVAAFRHRPATALSGGEQARVLLARALAQEAPLLMADEPIAALDPAHQIATMQSFKALTDQGKSCLVSLHDLGLAARHCTRILMLDQGQLVADGPPSEVLRQDRVKAVFGISAWYQDTDQGPIFQPLDVVR